MNARSFLVFGLFAGLIAGLLAFGVAHTIGEPSVNKAISLEDSGGGHHHDAASASKPHEHAEAEPVSRETQSTWGLLTATAAVGVALGGILSLVAAFAVGRLGRRLRPEASTALVGGLGFVAVFLVPFAKYPANPPSVGSPETLGERTATYFAMILISVVAMVVAVLAARRLARLRGAYVGVSAGVVGYVVLMLIVGQLMPTVNEVPAEFPADTLWTFRSASVAIQATIWGASTLLLCGFVVRAYRQAAVRSLDPRALASVS